MGNRISKVYTCTGDNGTTGLADGTRVDKDAPEIIAMSAVDELNSHIGLLLTEALPTDIHESLIIVQHDLFDIGAELSLHGTHVLTGGRVAELEGWLDRLNESLAPLREFILPGGSRAAALCHVARSVCRRTECQLTTAAWNIEMNPETLKYINRLSDLLFVVARALNQHAGHTDVFWRGRRDAQTR
jgi:cob(I)alamin adenosyltransferase